MSVQRSIRRRKRIGAVILLTLSLLFMLQWSTPAQTNTRLESRLTRLEYEVNALGSQVNQLQNQSGVRQPSSNLSPRPIPSQTTITSPLAEDPTFRRLATLVVELNERIRTLEEQVSALSSASP